MSKRKRPHPGSTVRIPKPTTSIAKVPSNPVLSVKPEVRLVPNTGKPINLTRPLKPRQPSHGIIPTFKRWLRG